MIRIKCAQCHTLSSDCFTNSSNQPRTKSSVRLQDALTSIASQTSLVLVYHLLNNFAKVESVASPQAGHTLHHQRQTSKSTLINKNKCLVEIPAHHLCGLQVMYILDRFEIINRLGMPSLAATGHQMYTRELELNPEARYGIMIALAISSGAFFVACIGLTISMCDWRMRYLHLRKELDERGYGMAARSSAQQDNQVGETPGGDSQVPATEEAAPTASGAL